MTRRCYVPPPPHDPFAGDPSTVVCVRGARVQWVTLGGPWQGEPSTLEWAMLAALPIVALLVLRVLA